MRLIKDRILGIDPGTNILGYAIIQVENKKYRIMDMGVIKLKQQLDHTDKLKEIFLQIQEIIENYLPGQMAIESPFFGKNVQSMLKLGRAQGVSMAAAITMGLSIEEYSPKKVKQSVTGNGNATKEQVCAMLENILGQKFQDQYLDATDALAVAVCHHHQHGNALGGQKKYNNWSSFIKENPSKLKSKK